MRHKFLRHCSAIAALASLLQPALAPVAFAQYAAKVTAQPASTDPLVTQYFTQPTSSPQLSYQQMTQLLRNKIKYVFVIFNENHSFDNEYGTFPGVNGLYSTGTAPRSAAATPGFTQTYVDTFQRHDEHRAPVPPRAGAERDQRSTASTTATPVSP